MTRLEKVAGWLIACLVIVTLGLFGYVKLTGNIKDDAPARPRRPPLTTGQQSVVPEDSVDLAPDALPPGRRTAGRRSPGKSPASTSQQANPGRGG